MSRRYPALIASFALCGFANVGTSIQVGGLGAMAPDRRNDLAKLGLRAMFAGAIATCLTACVAGVLSSTSAGAHQERARVERAARQLEEQVGGGDAPTSPWRWCSAAG